MKVKNCFVLAAVVLFFSFFLCETALAENDTELDESIHTVFEKKWNDAISENQELRGLYSNFSEPGLSISDRQKITEEFLYKLAEVENIQEGARGEYVNAKHLAVVEMYMGEKFYSTSPDKISQKNPENPNVVAGAILESSYEQIKALMYSEFVSEFLVADLIKSAKVYLNVDIGTIEWYFDDVVKKLDEELTVSPQKAKERIYNFGAWAIGLGYFNQKSFFNPFDDDCFYTHFTKNDRELKWQLDSIGKIPYDLASNDTAKQGNEAVRVKADTALINFHARKGDDVVYGGNKDDWFIGGTGNDMLDGGDGNDRIEAWAGDDIIWGGNGDDIIFAGEGNDIIFGGDGDDIIYPDNQNIDAKSAGEGNDIVNAGKGNDKIHSVYGDDTYIFNPGDGHDIIEDKYGEDTICFGDDINISDIKPVKSRKDLILYVEDDENSITIKNYYKKYKLNKNKNMYKIENLKFSDSQETTLTDFLKNF